MKLKFLLYETIDKVGNILNSAKDFQGRHSSANKGLTGMSSQSAVALKLKHVAKPNRYMKLHTTHLFENANYRLLIL